MARPACPARPQAAVVARPVKRSNHDPTGTSRPDGRSALPDARHLQRSGHPLHPPPGTRSLFRLGYAIDLVGITCFLLAAMALYLLLRHVNHNAAAAMVTFVAAGWLVGRSGQFPRALGVLLMLGGASFLLDLPAQFLFQGLSEAVSLLIVAPAAVAEPWSVGYLLIVGVRATTPRPHRPARPEPEPASR